MSFAIQSSLFGSNTAGRFGNQFFQLLFFFIISEKIGCTIRLPAWKGQLVFENHHFKDPIPVENIYNLELIYSRVDGPESTINMIKPLFNLFPDTLDIIGSFQFNTDTLYKFRHILDQNFIFTDSANFIKMQLNQIQKNDALICIHWREGDYNDFNNQHPFFWKSDFSNLLIEIKKLIAISGVHSKVYVASDNPKNIIDYLKSQGIEVLSARNFTTNINDFFLWDFMSLVASDIIVASNSSFSIAGALFNKNAQIFSRSNSPTEEFCTFLPWRTEILKNQFLS